MLAKNTSYFHTQQDSKVSMREFLLADKQIEKKVEFEEDKVNQRSV